MTGIFRLHDSIRVTPSIPIPAETSIPAGKSVFQRKLLIISFISFLRRGSPVMQKQPHAIAFQLQRIWNSPIEFGIRYEHDVLYVNGEEQYSFRFFHFLFCTFFHEFFATPFHQHYPDRA